MSGGRRFNKRRRRRIVVSDGLREKYRQRHEGTKER
jgi:hypothetical protein